MSRQMYGADTDELERLSAEFARVAEEIDGEANAMTGVLNRVSWIGDIATDYLGDWTGISLPKIGLSTQFLRDASENLRLQAQEQRDASTGDGGGSRFVGGRNNPGLERLKREAFDHLAKTPAEQLAWWNSLTPEQQQQLIGESPDTLTGLKGLPPDVSQRAQEELRSALAHDVLISSGEAEIHGSVGVTKVVSVGAGLNAGVNKYLDGTVEVELGGKAVVGAGVPGLSGEVGPNGTITYRFASEQEANQFLSELAMASLAETSPVLKIVTGNSVAKVLLMHADEYQSVSFGDTATGSLNTGPASGSVSIGTESTFNRDGSRSVSTSFDLSGSSAMPNDVAGAATLLLGTGAALSVGKQSAFGLSGSATVNYDSSGLPRSVTLTGSSMSGNSYGAFGLQSGNVTTGGTTTRKIELRLDDPVLASHAKQIVAAVERGDARGALAELGKTVDPKTLYDRSTVTESHTGTKSGKIDIDFGVGSAGGSVKSDDATSVSVKPPGGQPKQVYP